MSVVDAPLWVWVILNLCSPLPSLSRMQRKRCMRDKWIAAQCSEFLDECNMWLHNMWPLGTNGLTVYSCLWLYVLCTAVGSRSKTTEIKNNCYSMFLAKTSFRFIKIEDFCCVLKNYGELSIWQLFCSFYRHCKRKSFWSFKSFPLLGVWKSMFLGLVEKFLIRVRPA